MNRLKVKYFEPSSSFMLERSGRMMRARSANRHVAASHPYLDTSRSPRYLSGAMDAASLKFAQNLLPPTVWNLLRSRFGNRFEGDFASWSQAKAASGGYEDASIVERVAKGVRAVQEGGAASELDGVPFDTIQYSWPALASLLLIAYEKDGSLSVVDFGGSLGTSYRQNRKFLKRLKRVSWAVVEQDVFVQAGREFETEELRFFSNLDVAIAEARPNVVLLSGVLQYLPDPRAFLAELLQKPVEYLLFDRTPFIDGERDLLTVQRVPSHIYKASYPAWFLSRTRFWAALESEFLLIEQFDAKEHANVPSQYLGCLWQRRSALPSTQA